MIRASRTNFRSKDITSNDRQNVFRPCNRPRKTIIRCLVLFMTTKVSRRKIDNRRNYHASARYEPSTMTIRSISIIGIVKGNLYRAINLFFSTFFPPNASLYTYLQVRFTYVTRLRGQFASQFNGSVVSPYPFTTYFRHQAMYPMNHLIIFPNSVIRTLQVVPSTNCS